MKIYYKDITEKGRTIYYVGRNSRRVSADEVMAAEANGTAEIHAYFPLKRHPADMTARQRAAYEMSIN